MFNLSFLNDGFNYFFETKNANNKTNDHIPLKENLEEDWTLIPSKENLEEDWTLINEKTSLQESSVITKANKSFEEIEKEFDKEIKTNFNCSAISSLHSADTAEWRNTLIKAAQHNIVISGNYCGGKAFDELLDLIHQQMIEVPELEVVIIGHPIFVQNKPEAEKNPHRNKDKIKDLEEQFSTRFSFIHSPDTYHGAKKVTNHTKCTVIDYGKYFIQGGSGIKDNFILTGLDDLSVEDYLKSKDIPGAEQKMEDSGSMRLNPNEENVEAAISIENMTENVSSGYLEKSDIEKVKETLEMEVNSTNGLERIVEVEIENQNKQGAKIEEKAGGNDDGLLDFFIPRDFRDQDFIFGCSKEEGLEAGKKMYQEALFLAYKWDQYSTQKGVLGKHLPPQSWELDDLAGNRVDPVIIEYPALNDLEVKEPSTIHATDSSLYRMLKKPVPDLNSIHTIVPEFEMSHRKVDNVAINLFFTGPENDENLFQTAMIRKINQAKQEIIIDHMYFQPSNELMQALIDAAKRDVKITIVTTGITKNAPNGQLLFGPRNQYNYYYLTSSLNEQQRQNVTVYEYEQNNKGLHKKVLIVDDTLFAGSSNMGYKSLTLMGDHEMNFQAKSQDFINKTKLVIQEDIKHSVHVTNPETIAYERLIRAGFHSAGARIWG